jgi:hypothetical protein
MCDAIGEGLNERALDKDKRLEDEVDDVLDNDAKNTVDDEDNKPSRNSEGRRRRIGETDRDEGRRRVARVKK